MSEYYLNTLAGNFARALLTTGRTTMHVHNKYFADIVSVLSLILVHRVIILNFGTVCIYTLKEGIKHDENMISFMFSTQNNLFLPN